MTLDELMEMQASLEDKAVVRVEDIASVRDDGTYIIGSDQHGWFTYAWERGIKFNFKRHPDEVSAVAELIPFVERVLYCEQASRRAPRREDDPGWEEARLGQHRRLSGEGAESALAVLRECGLESVVPVAKALPGEPMPPEEVWMVLVSGVGQWSVGAVSRGQFAAYRYTVGLELGELLGELLRPSGQRHLWMSREDLERGGRLTAEGVFGRVGAAGGGPLPCGLVAGDVVDVVGSERGHHVYAAMTPLTQRAQPPWTVQGEYHVYRVAGELSGQEGVAAPAFEQPGGGAMVVLERPIRWYIDEGLLVEIDT
ncbi:hypothetical protein KEM60_02864 [Austwickia sp. TVS 96-490-7B]|uniref:TNT domain-containing protein n=1 Tax=Austwickia sp. TVS 96-490-7B TaxID=2830843 RepID=UPI001C55CF17|nr:TNT domain-containing protein [Austwickia sp. TVS 96-490-7B]MBW3086635.1 hypothetical protein [Austwickia sp. TVS 96-490-7B]